MPTHEPPPTLASFLLPAIHRQGWLLLILTLLGITAGAVVAAATPTRFAARAHLRVGTIDGDRPVIGPLTAAVEAADPSFKRQVQARAGAVGDLEFEGIYHTHLLAVRAHAAEGAAAEALVDTAIAMIVDGQNALIEQMQRDAGQRLAGTGETVAVVPTLSRPAQRIGDGAAVSRAGPYWSVAVAAGAGLGFVIGLLLAWARESRR